MKLNKQILEAINKGIQLALDDYQDIEDNSSVSQDNDVIDSKDIIKQRIELDKISVDLGLPSGTRWCKWNLGAETETDYGDYYAWGEIIPNKYLMPKYKNTGYTWNTYRFEKNEKEIKYNKNDKLIQLLSEDDAAYQNLHFYDYKFHIPTKDQCEELIKYTTNKWIRYKKSNTKGLLFISKINNNQIFIPAAGFYSGVNINGLNSNGCIWSSTVKCDERGFNTQAYYINFYQFNSDSNLLDVSPRFDGYSIRPVLNL